MLVGTRRGAGGELLNALGPQKRVIDLDMPGHLERDELVDYVRRRLLRDGEPGASTPYRGQSAAASQVAQTVADRASPSFLIAQPASRSLAAAYELVNTTRRGWKTQFPADVGSAMDDYLDRFVQESDRRRARDLLPSILYWITANERSQQNRTRRRDRRPTKFYELGDNLLRDARERYATLLEAQPKPWTSSGRAPKFAHVYGVRARSLLRGKQA